MREKPWKTNDWFVSPWNYAEEVCSGLKFKPNIQVHDVTLRDGEQQSGIVFNKGDKIRIAEALAEAGVHRIEAGMPAVSSSDAQAISELAKRNLGSRIFSFSRCMVDDVKRAIDCGVQGIVMEIPSSTHIIEKAYRWPLEKAIETSIESTAFAHQNGLEVVFFPIDFTRSEMDWALQMINRVAREGHMDALVLVDTFGVTTPHAMQYLVKQVKAKLNTRLEAHFHMDFGLGIANTIMALAEGVDVIHTTVLGIGERAGNVPMEETIMALTTLYGVDLGIKTSKLYALSRLVEKISGVKIPSNRPVVGTDLFNVESGIIASWYKTCGEDQLTELFPYRPELVGQNPVKIVMGKGSGLDTVRMWLDRLDMEANDLQVGAILAEVKDYSLAQKRLLTDDEFINIVKHVMGIL